MFGVGLIEVVTGGFLASGAGEGRMPAFASFSGARYLTSFRQNAEVRRKIPCFVGINQNGRGYGVDMGLSRSEDRTAVASLQEQFLGLKVAGRCACTEQADFVASACQIFRQGSSLNSQLYAEG